MEFWSCLYRFYLFRYSTHFYIIANSEIFRVCLSRHITVVSMSTFELDGSSSLDYVVDVGLGCRSPSLSTPFPHTSFLLLPLTLLLPFFDWFERLNDSLDSCQL